MWKVNILFTESAGKVLILQSWYTKTLWIENFAQKLIILMKIDTFENGLKSAAFWKRIVLIAGAYWNGGSY